MPLTLDTRLIVARDTITPRRLLLQCPLDGISPILAEYTMLAQLGSGLQNALLHGGLHAIPSATALMIGKRNPIQPLTGTAGNP